MITGCGLLGQNDVTIARERISLRSLRLCSENAEKVSR